VYRKQNILLVFTDPSVAYYRATAYCILSHSCHLSHNLKISLISNFGNFLFLSPSCFSLFIIFCHKMRTAAPQVKTVCPILMFITACDIYIKSENDCRLYILLYYELKFNRNNLFMFKHIFSIKNLKHKWFLLVITHVHSLNKYIFLSMFIVCMFDICNHAITVLFYFSDYKNCHLQTVKYSK
jgi:hypothetical protein